VWENVVGCWSMSWSVGRVVDQGRGVWAEVRMRVPRSLGVGRGHGVWTEIMVVDRVRGL
jgi:hypothetical protein